MLSLIKRVYLKSLLALLPVVCTFADGFSQFSTDRCNEVSRIWKAIRTTHLMATRPDDSLSAHVFDSFIDLLDKKGLYFTEPDIRRLSEKYRLAIDDMLISEDCSLFEDVAVVFDRRLGIADSLIGAIMTKPMVFNGNEQLEFSATHIASFARDEAALLDRWNRWMKYQVLERLLTPDGEIENPLQADTKTLLKRVDQVKKEAGNREKRNIRKIRDYSSGFKNYIAYIFYNAFTTVFDPHTQYFSYDDATAFGDMLSNETMSFGLEVGQNVKNEVEITRLIPGSSAWKCNQLNKGDVLISASWNDNPPVDFSFSDAEEVMEILWQNDVKVIELTVRKLNEAVKTVKLVKEKINSEENAIRSFILDGDHKIGYIALPSFYMGTDMNGLGCANDVAKELLILKKENIQGLILDLRNNGGGSVHEALALAGIFIDIGPVTVSTDRYGTIEILKDMNRGTVYDGPLIVLVNSLSASASEIFAAAMQDYHRALIVGSRTYGKSTGQQIFSMEEFGSRGFSNAFIKITTARYNRITGASHQLRGISPDIHLPDLFEQLDYYERSYPSALAPDTVTKKIYYTPLSPLPVRKLSDMSAERILKSSVFKGVINLSNVLWTMKEETEPVPLNLEGYKKYREDKEYNWSLWDKMVQEESHDFEVTTHSFEQELARMDSYSRELDEMNREDVKNDIYIAEAYRIMIDFIIFGK